MEIKKGISQMAEYPNMEINYVIPSDGRMYYVLKDGVLPNGAIIATLDPKRAVDANVLCDSIGVFKEDGSVLIDFNKKDIKKITDDLLLVVSGNPVSNEVTNAQANRDDSTVNGTLKENQISIVDNMMKEMGITGSMLFSDPFEEANVYKLDSYNNKVGIDCSFIGKNDKELFFHTNDIAAETTKINYLEANDLSVGNEPPSIDNMPVMNHEIESIDQDELKLDIGSDILDGFQKNEDEKPQVDDLTVGMNSQIESTNDAIDNVMDSPDEIKEANDATSDIANDITENVENVVEASNDIKVEADNTMEIPSDITEGVGNEIENTSPVVEAKSDDDFMNIDSQISTDETVANADKDQVLDNVIAVMKKMIAETGKLNEKIDNLEKELAEKNRLLEAQESKKNELSSLLTEANEVLENIDE